MFKANASFEGKVKVEKFSSREATEPNLVLDWFSNLITDQSLQRVADGTHDGNVDGDLGNLWGVGTQTESSSTVYGDHGALAVGTGSSSPVSSNTSLNSFLIKTSRTINYTENEDSSETEGYAYASVEVEFEFTENEANDNLTEFGLYSNDTSGNQTDENGTLMTHGLFRDENGDPTTITKLQGEILRITYEMRLYASFFQNTDMIDFDGTTYTFTTIETDLPSSSSRGLFHGSVWSEQIMPTSFNVDHIGTHNDADAPSDFSVVRWGDINSTDTYDASDLNSSSRSSGNEDGTPYLEMFAELDTGQSNYASGIRAFKWFQSSATFINGSSCLYTYVDPAIMKTSDDRLQITGRMYLGAYSG